MSKLFYLLLILLGCSLASATSSPINYWSFDTNVSGVAVADIGTINGTLEGDTVMISTECGNNNCYDFDGGNDYIDFNADILSPIGGSFTICSWARPDNSNKGILWSQGPWNSDEPFVFRLHNSDDKLYQLMTDSLGTYEIENPWSATTYATNVLYHFCFVLDSGNNKSVYVNGSIQETAATAVIDIEVEAHDFLIGIGSDMGNDWYGTLDELAIYNFSLTDSEVLELFNNNGVPVTAPAVPGVVLISNYNLTSSGGCTNWNTNTSNPCGTNDTTPTITFDTNVSSNCAIGRTDVNFTTMGNSRNCSTTGTTSHICTVIAADNLSFGLNNVFLGCGTPALENSTSSSSALVVDVSYPLVSAEVCNGADFNFIPSLDYYNLTTGKLLQSNVNATNQSRTGCVFNVTGIENTNITLNINATNPTYKFKCNSKDDSASAIEVNTTKVNLTEINQSGNVNILCWLDYLNATAAYYFNLTIE